MMSNHQQITDLQATIQTKSLNGLLDWVEADIGKLEAEINFDALEILYLLDEILSRLETASLRSNSPRSEITQYDYVGLRLKKNASRFLRAIGGAKRYQALRLQRLPPANAWWWFLDEWVQSRNKTGLLKWGVKVGVGLLILLVAIVLYKQFLAPDPATIAVYNAQLNATQYLATGNIDAAKKEIQSALVYEPDNPEILILEGVALQKSGDLITANRSLDHARDLLQNDEVFHLSLAQVYLQISDLPLALSEAQSAIQGNPESAEGYYFMGKAFELMGNTSQAIQSYNTAANLAEIQGKTELVATIRLGLGVLMQSAPPDASLSPSLEPTP